MSLIALACWLSGGTVRKNTLKSEWLSSSLVAEGLIKGKFSTWRVFATTIELAESTGPMTAAIDPVISFLLALVSPKHLCLSLLVAREKAIQFALVGIPQVSKMRYPRLLFGSTNGSRLISSMAYTMASALASCRGFKTELHSSSAVLPWILKSPAKITSPSCWAT